MLRIKYRVRPRKLQGTYGAGGGPEARLKRLRTIVTALIRYERIESSWSKCHEARGYAERLIDIAIRNGDKDPKTMDLADYWLLEKDLIHKLFKVIVPRYQNSNTACTNIYPLPHDYGGIKPHLHVGRGGVKMGVLELKGNMWPPVLPKQRNTKHLLTNVLLDAFRKDYEMGQKIQELKKFTVTESSESSVQQPVGSDAEVNYEGTSVDPPQEQLSKDFENLELSTDKKPDSPTKSDT